MDDILTGSSTLEDKLALREQVQSLLIAGGFELRKWASSHPPLLQNIPPGHCQDLSHTGPLLLNRDSKFAAWVGTPRQINFSTMSAELKRLLLNGLFLANIYFRRLCILRID